jgi:hypothetical protein
MIAIARAVLVATAIATSVSALRAETAKPASPAPSAAPAKARPLPPVERDTATLPPRIAAMREAIIEAAKSGDVERLRLVIERNELPPLFAKGQKGDVIAALKTRSDDGQGRDTLAALVNALEAGFVRVNAGTAQEMYVWPWFAEYPPQRLDGAALVEVYRIVPARDFKQSLERDRYLGHRLGIGPDGTWHYFLSGE